MSRLQHFAARGFISLTLLAGCSRGERQSVSADGQAPDQTTGGAAGSAAGPTSDKPASKQAPGPGAAPAATMPQSASTPAGSAAPKPVDGPSDFVSADDNPNQAASRTAHGDAIATAPAAATAGAAATSMRSVERGDIYRMLDDHRILNLNSFRGVQILDVSDVSQPRIEGRLAVAGQPVELYVVNDRAIVLLNNLQGYYGARDDVKVESVQGGLLMSVDIHDRAHPVLVDRASVPGTISTSRLTQGAGQAALYVAATNYDGSANAVIASFDVSDGKFTSRSQLNLGGSVQDIQATTDILMVASLDSTQNQARSRVSVIDISRPDGTMVSGGSVLARGTVQNKFNMDAYNGVLRIVSGANGNGALSNHLETFDLSNLQRLAALDHCVFGNRSPNGQSEMLYATAFVENRGFFVTYYRKDPFHAFSIDDTGHCQEHSEFIVSGWNDFLRPTLNDTRLIGIGHNDENNVRKLSVSLYDAQNLANPTPLRARADIDLPNSYSEASWDDRSFGVIEDAVSVKAPDGTSETGLVLLPFQGWDSSTQTQLAQVQIFTFSDHTLTKRGSMDHGSPVRRSFETSAPTTANLSEEQLSLFDVVNPDAPKSLGRVELAPNYSALYVFGDYVARVKDRSYYFDYARNNQTREIPKSEVQILPRAADLDAAAPLATFSVPANADLVQAGALLVSVLTTTTYDSTGNNAPQYHTLVNAFDLSDPTRPRARGSFETDRIVPNYGGRYYPLAGAGAIVDCLGPGCGGYDVHAQRYVVGQAIVFAAQLPQQKSFGMVHQCTQFPPPTVCSSGPSGNTVCPQPTVSGSRTCTTPKGGQTQCSGGFSQCDARGNCTPVAAPPGLQESCNDFEQFRYWQSYAFDALDLRDPDKLSLADRLELPADEEASSLLASGETLYVNQQRPVTVQGDPRSHVKHFARLVDLSDPQHPHSGEPVNVPGDVLAVDGSTLYTRDLVWNDNDARTLVARLILSGNLAHLQASHLFADRSVQTVQLDGAGHMLVSSDPASGNARPAGANSVQAQHKLSILDAQSLDIRGEADVDAWATFKDAARGRALFQVSGGLLLFDVRDASQPKAQAYFATQGWPNEIFFDGQDILFAAGPYGVYRFDAGTFNLLMK
jgi:hypothetical protein